MPAPFIGLDVAKDTIVAGQWPEARTWTVANTPDGIEQLTDALVRLAPAAIVLEATGGYQDAAAAADLPVATAAPIVASGLGARDSAAAEHGGG